MLHFCLAIRFYRCWSICWMKWEKKNTANIKFLDHGYRKTHRSKDAWHYASEWLNWQCDDFYYACVYLCHLIDTRWVQVQLCSMLRIVNEFTWIRIVTRDSAYKLYEWQWPGPDLHLAIHFESFPIRFDCCKCCCGSLNEWPMTSYSLIRSFVCSFLLDFIANDYTE